MSRTAWSYAVRRLAAMRRQRPVRHMWCFGWPMDTALDECRPGDGFLLRVETGAPLQPIPAEDIYNEQAAIYSGQTEPKGPAGFERSEQEAKAGRDLCRRIAKGDVAAIEQMMAS